MKTTSQRVAWFVLLVIVLAVCSPLVSKSQTPTSSPAETSTQTVKWKFGGNDAGTSSYETHADGTFVSSTELNIVGMTLKSRLTGKLVDGAITEFELVNQQAGTEVTVSALVSHNRDMPDYGLPPLNGAPAPVSYSNFYGLTDDRTVQDVAVASALVEHRISNTQTIRNRTQFSHYTTDAVETGASRVGTYANGVFTALPTNTTGNQTNLPTSALSVLLGSHDRRIDDDAFDNQTDFIDHFSTGSIAHTLLAGAEIGRDTYDNQSYLRVDPGIRGAAGLAVVALDQPAYAGAPANAVKTTGNLVNSTADTLAAYFNDTAALNEQWQLVWGLRWDRFKASLTNSINRDNTAGNVAPPSASQTVTFTSVRAGAIYQPTRQESYYVAYGTSFNPSLESLTLTSGQQNLDPEKNRSFELGAKWDLSGGKLSLTSAVFQVQKTNARTQVSTGVYELDGDVRVNGAELSAAGVLAPDWRVVAGYTYLDAEIVKASAFDGTEGKVPANTPRNAVNVWTTYDISREWEIGAGLTYMSARFANNANVVTAPGFTRFDATLAYHQPRYDIRLNLFNVTDKDHIAALITSDGGRSVPGIGRTLLATLTWRI